MVSFCEEESMSQKEATMWARLKSGHRIVANVYMNKSMFYTRILYIKALVLLCQINTP